MTAYTNDGVETKAASAEVPVGDICISANFNKVVLNGATIERAADGHLVISSSGTVITKPDAANDSASRAKSAPEIPLRHGRFGGQVGDEMEDGTIYAGISPDTHKPIYARPKDESGTYNFNDAPAHAKLIGDGFRVPTKNELNVLWENRNKGKLKGTFNETGRAAGRYWSSSPDYDFYLSGWAQRFSDGRHASHQRPARQKTSQTWKTSRCEWSFQDQCGELLKIGELYTHDDRATRAETIRCARFVASWANALTARHNIVDAQTLGSDK